MPKILANPFFIYIGSFLIVLLTYQLRWSILYPPLGGILIIFFLVTFLFSIGGGLLLLRFRKIEFKPIEIDSTTGMFTVLLWIGFLTEFVYNKGIPIITILKGGSDYDYRLFGIPTFHVILMTLNSFFAVYIFHQLCSKFSNKGLFFFLLNLVPSILIVSRGTFFMILTSCLFIFIMGLKAIRLKIIVILSVLVLVVFYLFGIMGNLRQANTTSSEYILEISKATYEFRNSRIPKEYIWSYLYISSPFANLQNTIDRTTVIDWKWESFIVYELLPDFISKRFGMLSDLDKEDVPRIADWLTVSTFYARPYHFLGWTGVVFMFLFFFSTTIFYLFLLKRRSKYYVTGLAIMNTIVLFNTFDNMYAFTGLSFQLVYPILFSIVKIPKVKFILNKAQNSADRLS